MFGSARIPFSEAQKRAVLDWARELGVADLPSLHSLKTAQDEIEKCVGHPTNQVESINGNVFYINDIGMAIGKVGKTTTNAIRLTGELAGLC